MEEPHNPQAEVPAGQGTAPAPATEQYASERFAPTNQQPTVQQQPAVSASRPRYRLHHSYIWLGSLRALPYVVLTLVVMAGSAMSALFADAASYSSQAIVVSVLLWVVVVLLIAAAIIGVLAVSYRYIWYEFDPTEFSYYSGIFSKKRTHVPYQKVQSVNEKASLLQRLVGVCSVTVETAGGAENKAVIVSYVEKSAGERIRRELFLRKNLLNSGLTPAEVDAKMSQADMQAVLSGAAPMASVADTGVDQAPVSPLDLETQRAEQVASTASGASAAEYNVLDLPANVADDMRGLFAGAEVDTGKITYEYGLSNKELLLSAITGQSSFALAMFFAICSITGFVSTLVDFRLVSNELAVYQAAGQTLGNMFGSVTQGVVIVVIAAIVVGWLVYVGGTCLSYGGFRARRRGDRIEVERGILTHLFSGMDIDRVQSITVHQSFFQRILGYCSLSYGRVVAFSEESTENASTMGQDRLVVHPFLPLSKVQEVVSQLTPEYAQLPEAQRRVSPKALRRALTRRGILQGFGFWLAVCDFAAVALMNIGSSIPGTPQALVHEIMSAPINFSALFAVVLVLAVVIFVLEVVGAALWYRRSAFGFDQSYITIVNGGYSVETTTVPRTKIQLAQTRTNPLQRHAGVATLIAISAAGVGGKRERLIDVTDEDAKAWLAWARPGGSGSV